MLPLMVRRQLYQHGWDKVTYKDLLQCPLGKLVTCQIALAVEEHATRITYGLPPGLELSKEDEAEILACHEGFVGSTNAAAEKVREETDQPVSPARDGFVRFHRRDGLPEVPWWREIDGQWFRHPGVLMCFYPYLQQHLCERLVSLDRRPLDGGKAEWIEYTSITSQADEDRRFMRVDLVLETNNSITVELLESRIEHSDATVWWRHWKV